MNNRPKEATYDDFMEMIKKSWTWQRMTDTECSRFIEVMERSERAVKGSYLQRREIYQAIYSAYLYGLGYNGFNWREGQITVWTAKVRA